MSAKDDTAARRPTKDGPGKGGGTGRDEGRGGKQPPGELGRALKTAYDNTLREEVPKDFLDLLGKLS